jgi:hypothetical protein
MILTVPGCRGLKTSHLIRTRYWSAFQGMFHFSVLMLMNDLITLCSRAEMLGLKSYTWDTVNSISDLPGMIFGMRNVLHLAASFSPLIVLVPRKFTLDTIRRDHILAVRLIFLTPIS